MSDSNATLLPCPFCGGEELTRSVDGGVLPWIVEQRGEVTGPYYTTCTIYCDTCGCELQWYAASDTTCAGLYEQAIENTYNAWNTRAERTCKPIESNTCLSGTDCPAWKCSECGELFEMGVNYCSNCGARVVNDD